MKISIITPTFNSEKTITRTMESVIMQTFYEIQHIIIDNNSDDATISLVSNYKEKYKNLGMELLVYVENDKGLYDAINKGVLKSTGDYIGVLSSNDYFYSKHSIQIIHDAITSCKVDCVYGNLEFRKNDKISRRWTSKEYHGGDFFKSWTPAHPTFYYKKKLHEIYGFYRTDYKIASDVDFMFRLLEIHKITFKYIDQLLIVMSDGGISNNGIKSKLIITKEMFNTFRENGYKTSKIKYILYKILKIREKVIIK